MRNVVFVMIWIKIGLRLVFYGFYKMGDFMIGSYKEYFWFLGYDELKVLIGIIVFLC